MCVYVCVFLCAGTLMVFSVWSFVGFLFELSRYVFTNLVKLGGYHIIGICWSTSSGQAHAATLRFLQDVRDQNSDLHVCTASTLSIGPFAHSMFCFTYIFHFIKFYMCNLNKYSQWRQDAVWGMVCSRFRSQLLCSFGKALLSVWNSVQAPYKVPLKFSLHPHEEWLSLLSFYYRPAMVLDDYNRVSGMALRHLFLCI